MVLLKRLTDALADGDTIHAVILGSAINNDGADKVGYTAPSVRGQTAVILEAQAAADVHPDQISYIEAHGTGTPLGDPIELRSLTQAFQTQTQRTGYCAIGSVKPNIGHADTAAGIAGLIKTVLALKHRQLPPSLHFKTPNPQIDFANSPFFVCDRLRDWEIEADSRRCAGVSSFGIGGTNAHVIVADLPVGDLPVAESNPGSGMMPISQPTHYLLPISAKTKPALVQLIERYQTHLQTYDGSLADLCYTAQLGRCHFNQRQALIVSSLTDLRAQLSLAAGAVLSEQIPSQVPSAQNVPAQLQTMALRSKKCCRD